MKKNYSTWKHTVYGKSQIKYYSKLIKGEGDTGLRTSSKARKGWIFVKSRWTKLIVLRPICLDPEAWEERRSRLRMWPGYYSKKFEVCQVSKRTLRLSDGPFAMRMGPENCYFFVMANFPVHLDFCGYIRGDMKLY